MISLTTFCATPFAGSAAKHSHSHSHSEPSATNTFNLPTRNLHAKLTPEDRLERLMMFLEAQFGADNVAPIAEPKLPPLSPKKRDSKRKLLTDGEKQEESSEHGDGEDMDAYMDVSEDEEEAERRLKERQQAELARLHRLGIPVPGISIKVDKLSATVWLEDLEVECSNRILNDRVRAVVERAVEVTAPLWG